MNHAADTHCHVSPEIEQAVLDFFSGPAGKLIASSSPDESELRIEGDDIDALILKGPGWNNARPILLSFLAQRREFLAFRELVAAVERWMPEPVPVAEKETQTEGSYRLRKKKKPKSECILGSCFVFVVARSSTHNGRFFSVTCRLVLWSS